MDRKQKIAVDTKRIIGKMLWSEFCNRILADEEIKKIPVYNICNLKSIYLITGYMQVGIKQYYLQQIRRYESGYVLLCMDHAGWWHKGNLSEWEHDNEIEICCFL